MRNLEFKAFLDQLPSLNVNQIKELKYKLQTPSRQKETALLLSKQRAKTCPHCQSEAFNRFGFQAEIQRYRCKSCHRTFNELTGTPLARLRKKEEWIEYAQSLVEAQTVRKAAEVCGVHKNTSFLWRHRFLTFLKDITPETLTGIVEFHETYFKYSEKGTRHANETPVNEANNTTVPQKKKQPVCVVFARDRHQNTLEYILPKFSSKSLCNKYLNRVSADSLVCSDLKPEYQEYTKSEKLRHGKLQLSKGETVIKDIVHLKNVQNYEAELNNWLRRFRGVASKYLDTYLGWYRNLDEFNLQLPKRTLLLRAKNKDTYLHQRLTRTKG